MAETVAKSPRLVRIESGEASINRRAVALLYQSENGGRKFWIEYGLEVIPATITALSSLLGTLSSSLPENERPNPQTIGTVRARPAMSSAGEFGLQLEMEGGGLLTVGIPTSDLAAIRDMILEAIEMTDRPRHN